MYPELLHIYGPLGIKSYGLCITIGLIIFIAYTYRFLVRTEILSEQHYFSLMFYGITSAIVGGRLLYISYHLEQIHSILDICALWLGGFSILGSVLGVSITTTLYIRFNQLPFAQIVDRFALFGPLLQGISRIGCFLSGCCWGIPSSSICAITYHHPDVSAPLGIALHPTQLYSAVTLLIIFFIFYYCKFLILKRPGLMLALYFLLVSLERFIIDFWRGEREFFSFINFAFFSINQWIALCIILGSLIYLICTKKNYEFIHPYQKPSIHS